MKIKVKKDLKHLNKFLRAADITAAKITLARYGEKGVALLREATPKDTGVTANSWYYKISTNLKQTKFTLTFHNANVVNGVPIAIILQYGHATRNGGYVAGRDYINPPLQKVFDELSEKAWEEIRRL